MMLSVENGSFGYSKNRRILSDINFSAQSGDLVAILGPNGAGKTTLLRCIMGFLKWSGGRSLIDKTDIRAFSQRELWQHISYVPQAKGTVTSGTVEEMILLGRSSRIGLFSQPGSRDLAAAEDIMRRLHIENLSGKKCSEISGGELQMVLIARALAGEPQILILDEPESNLDFRNQLIVLDTLSDLAKQGMICIFNTHYPAHALQRANKSLILDKDGGVLFGETHSVVTEQNIEKAFGVRAVIGEVETPEKMIRNVIPLEISKNTIRADNKRKIAVIAIIADNSDESPAINKLLHEYQKYLVGRMGMPYRRAGVNIITVTLDAPESEVAALSARLSGLQGISVKTTYSAAIEEEKE